HSIVVIPVYKEKLNDSEIKSLQQCLHILEKYPICLVGPEGLDLTTYRKIFDSFDYPIRFEPFAPSFFTSVMGYNRLMLNKAFYERFSNFEYILIYQLDAYVFRDELKEWCNKGYDYIGAPFTKPNGDPDLANSGNGGLSLRRTAAFLKIFEEKGEIFTKQGLKEYHRFKHPFYRWIPILAGTWHIGNKLSNYLNSKHVNEDIFYSSLKHKQKNPFRVAPTEVAQFFAFEKSPAQFFKATGEKLPFGCHAWEKWEYESFWKKYIKL
ncbi:MAG: hypothetical protein LIP01_07225, partial [Tannerellaceae bacterium]|nr:hypothetical protein [Tannerellaceae bacterium]